MHLPLTIAKILVDVLEVGAAIPSLKAMVKDYLPEIVFLKCATVLEIWCGTGPISRSLATWLNVVMSQG